jgi:hypothetical protein
MIAAAISCFAFAIGYRMEASALLNRSGSAGAARSLSHQNESTEFADAVIHHNATATFEQLYESLHSASTEMRDKLQEQLEALPPGPKRNAALRSFYRTLVQLDPVAAANAVRKSADKQTRAIALDAIVGAAPHCAMDEMAKLLLEMPRERIESHSFNYLEDVFNRWSRIDPAAAAKFLEEHPNDGVSEYAGAILWNWAGFDPKAAKEWLDQQLPRDDASALMRDFVTGWFEVDRSAAANFALAHAEDPDFEDAVRSVASSFYPDFPDATRDFIYQIPNDDMKAKVLSEIAWVGNGIKRGDADDWKHSPRVVADWMVSFPPDLIGDALRTLVERWKELDAPDLLAWMSQLPGDVREVAVSKYSFSNKLSLDDEVALVTGMSDVSLREQLLRQLMGEILSTEEAKKMVQESQLSPEQKAYLLKLVALTHQQ